jgi:hypothetical protein
MKRQSKLYPYYIGFRCYDGSFSMVIKNHKNLGFNTRKESEEHIKKIQPKYKHHLEVWHNV